jgi:hypothetical protein
VTAAKEKSRRGGPNNRGKLLSHNSSGLCAIRFGYESGVLRVYVAFMEGKHPRRTSYSVEANGARGALEMAIRRRRDADLPVPSLSTALRALREFMRS